jgi:hypothetical protein
MIHQHSDSAGLWLFTSGQPIRVVATRPLVMQTWATHKDHNPIHLTENLNWTPNLCKIRRIWEPWFYIYRGTTLWTVPLKRPIFKQKKGFANLSLGLIYHSKALPQPPSRDTVPLTFGWQAINCVHCTCLFEWADERSLYWSMVLAVGGELAKELLQAQVLYTTRQVVTFPVPLNSIRISEQ